METFESCRDLSELVHHHEDFHITCRVVKTHDVEIALIEFSESAFLRIFSTPYFVDVVAFEGDCQLISMKSHETCKRYGQNRI